MLFEIKSHALCFAKGESMARRLILSGLNFKKMKPVVLRKVRKGTGGRIGMQERMMCASCVYQTASHYHLLVIVSVLYYPQAFNWDK